MFPEELRKAFAPSHPLSWLLAVAAAYVFVAPNIDVAPALHWHDGQRLGQLVLLGISVVLMLGFPGAFGRVLGAWSTLSGAIRWPLIFAFSFGAVSSLIAEQPRWAFLEWGMLLLLATLAFGVAAGRRELGETADRAFTLLLYATALTYTVKALVIYLSMLLVGPGYGMIFDVRELFTGFSNVRFFGQMQTLLLPFLVLPAIWWGNTPARRVMFLGIPAFWWMLAIGSGTRGTWVALFIAGIVVHLFGNRHGRLWLNWQIKALASGAVIYVVFILLIPELLARPASFLHRSDDILSLSNRGLLWTESVNLTLAHPWLGIGPMHFSNAWNPVAAHPHNAALQLMAEWGIPAALLFVLVFAVAGLTWALRVRAVTAASPDAYVSMTSLALLAALTGAAAQAMVDGVIVMPVTQTMLAVICGWAIGHYLGPVHPAVTRSGRLQAIIVLFAACAVAYGVAPDIRHIEQREAAYFKGRPPGEILLPRFWAQGWINQ